MTAPKLDSARVAQGIRTRVGKFIRVLALEADRRVRLKTPVDTGRARGNWSWTIGRPVFLPTDEKDQSGAKGMAKARSDLSAATAGDGWRRNLYLVNGLPYILKLEYGSSRKNPHGMVRMTVAELRPLVEAIAARIKSGGT